MMMIREGHITIEVSGSGAAPNTISVRNLSRILSALERGVAVISQQIAPEITEPDLFVSLVDVERGNSGDYWVQLKQPEIQLRAFDRFASLIQKGVVSGHPTAAVEQAEEIAIVSRKERYLISLSARTNGHISRATVTPESKYELPEPSFLEGETVIFGEIERVGGKSPTATIRLSESDTITAKVSSRKLAVALGQHMYERRGLKGVAKWRLEDYEIIDFMITDIDPYEAVPLESTLSELRSIAGPYYDDIGDIQGYIEHQRDD